MLAGGDLFFPIKNGALVFFVSSVCSMVASQTFNLVNSVLLYLVGDVPGYCSEVGLDDH